MALVDTNCNPDPIDYVIACNDDALKSIKLILQALMQAIIDRKNELNVGVAKGDEREKNKAKKGKKRPNNSSLKSKTRKIARERSYERKSHTRNGQRAPRPQRREHGKVQRSS